MKIIKSSGPEIFDIELEKDLLAKNRSLAKENRKRFDRSNILAIDIMGSIGSGKTSLIKAILKRLGMGKEVAVIAGDLTTTIDAERIETEGARIKYEFCGYEGGIISDQQDHFQHPAPCTCLKCGSFQVKVEKGRECILKKIQAVR